MGSAEDRTFVVSNAKDWHSIYLSAVYSSFIDAEFYTLQSLADAELKSQLMGLEDEIIVLESKSNPVVKKYDSFLKASGFNYVGKYEFVDYDDLQKYLIDDIGDVNGLIVFGTDFAMEEVAAFPYLVNERIFPVFYSPDSQRFIERRSRNENILFVGRIPIRAIENLPGEKLLGSPHDTALDMMTLSLENTDAEWGIIMRIDEIDFASLKTSLPVFIFYGSQYVDVVVDAIKKTDIINYEVIGGNTADIAGEIEEQTQKDLNMLLKFGRKVTNVAGLEGTILDVDTVPAPFPSEKLEITNVVYYSDLGIFALTLENKGNVDVMFLTNMEFSGEVLADEYYHQILAGQTKTVPFEISSAQDNEVIITTRYGYVIPFRYSVEGTNGSRLYQTAVPFDDYTESADLTFIDNSLDLGSGELLINYKSSGLVNVYAELQFDEEKTYTSDISTINGEGSLRINFPYISNEELVGKQFNVTTYYGGKDTLFVTSNTIRIEAAVSYTIYIVSGAVLLILLVVLLLFFGRKNKNRSSTKKKRR